MNAPTLYRDVMTASFFMAGILAFVSGQFILSTLLFGAASLTTNLPSAQAARI